MYYGLSLFFNGFIDERIISISPCNYEQQTNDVVEKEEALAVKQI